MSLESRLPRSRMNFPRDIARDRAERMLLYLGGLGWRVEYSISHHKEVRKDGPSALVQDEGWTIEGTINDCGGLCSRIPITFYFVNGFPTGYYSGIRMRAPRHLHEFKPRTQEIKKAIEQYFSSTES